MGDPVVEIGGALEQLFRLAASRKVHARQAAAAGVSISPPGSVLLRRLADQGPLTLGDLARGSDMDPAATGRQVRQLEEQGLVRRTTDAGDGRVTVVRLTADGRNARRRLDTVRHRHMEDVLGRWTHADRQAFARLLARYVEGSRSVHYHAVAEDKAS